MTFLLITDIKHPTVQSIILSSRVNQTGTTLTGKSTVRPFAFDDYTTQRHLEQRAIRRDPFQTLETINGATQNDGKKCKPLNNKKMC
jgi:hypothetical protein